MKKVKVFLIVGIALLLLVAVALMINTNIIAHAKTITPQKIIVNGSCENYFAPDTAYVTMGVVNSTESNTTTEVSTLEYNPTNLDNVLETLNSNGITKDNIFTKTLNMPFDMFNNMRTSNTVSSLVEFKTTDIDNLNTLISTLQSDNANVKCVRYTLEDATDEYSSVLKCAIDNAVEKVETMFEGVSYNIVEVIEDHCFSPQCYTNSMFKTDGTKIDTEGSVLICGNVKVVFELTGDIGNVETSTNNSYSPEIDINANNNATAESNNTTTQIETETVEDDNENDFDNQNLNNNPNNLENDEENLVNDTTNIDIVNDVENDYSVDTETENTTEEYETDNSDY